MSNHYVYAREFCTGFRKKLLDSIDDPEYVYMLGIATLLDGTHRSVKFMEAAWSVQLQIGVEAGDNTVGKLQRIF